MGVNGSKKQISNFLTELPGDIQVYILVNVIDQIYSANLQFVDIQSIVALRRVSLDFKLLIYHADTLWRNKFSMYFPCTYLKLEADEKQRESYYILEQRLALLSGWDLKRDNLYEEFVRTWKEEKRNCWVDLSSYKNFLTNNYTNAIHGNGTWFFPLRAKNGFEYKLQKFTTPGYRSGVHYWEVIPKKCIDECSNTFVGVCLSDVDKCYNIGYDSCKFGILIFFSFLQLDGGSGDMAANYIATIVLWF
jgi:hypothetical protein